MHVFVTGATGFVGSAVVRELLAAGHRVTGLVRNPERAAALATTGATPHIGDLHDAAGIAAAAGGADAVIHTAFIHDFSNFDASIAVEQQVVPALGEALAGSGKPFLITSGAGLLPRGTVDEDTPPATEGHAARRGPVETLALGFADRGVRVGIVRLPFSVHGRGDHGFVPALIDIARRTGVSAHVEDGSNLWPAVHRDDAARLYRLALEAGVPMPRYHPIGDAGIPFRDIAAAIGEGLGVPVTSIPASTAMEHFGWMGGFVGLDIQAASDKTRAALDWAPTGPGLIADLEIAGYFDS